MKQLWLDSGWKPRLWPTAREFVQTHNRWITVLGAAIVFAMFVIKDAYQEGLKEVVASISTAQNLYEVEHSLTDIDRRIGVLQRRLSNIESNVSRSGTNPEPSVTSASNLNWDDVKDAFVTAFAKELKNDCLLLNEIPDHIEEKNTCIEMTKDLLLESANSRASSVNQESTEYIMDVFSLTLRFAKREQQEQTLHDKILEAAELERNRRERRVHQATIASYVLYPFGWIIGLLGKLYGDGEGPALE